MIETVVFTSQAAIENLIQPDPNTAVISIVGSGCRDAKIKDGFHSVLRLSFDDLSEETVGWSVGCLPDAAEDGGQLYFEAGRFPNDPVFPDINHAKAITTFLDELECRHLVVHCHAGVSRSAAVAKFVSVNYGARLVGKNTDVSFANRRLLRLLDKARCVRAKAGF